MSDIYMPSESLVTSATAEDARREASARQGRIQRSPAHRMGHRRKGGWGGGGAAPPPDYGVSAYDLAVRCGLPLHPTMLNPAIYREPDLFSATPATDSTVFWQGNVSNLDIGSGIYIIIPDGQSFPYAERMIGPRTGPIGSASEVFPDTPCTIAFYMWAHSSVFGIGGYAPFCSVECPSTGWGRNFAPLYPGWLTAAAALYITYKPAATQTVYGTAATLGESGDGRHVLCVFRQTSTTATFTVIQGAAGWTGGTPGTQLPGSYSEARTPSGATLRLGLGTNSGDAISNWRTFGCLGWSTPQYIPDSDIYTYATTYFNYP